MNQIYQLKNEVFARLEKRTLDSTGTVQELRQPLVDSCKSHTEEVELETMLDVKPNDPARILTEIRKRNCHFDGRDVYSFIERADELKIAYGISDTQMLQGLQEILREDTRIWDRDSGKAVITSEQFKNKLIASYFPPGQRRHLDSQIANRKQGNSENIRTYIINLTSLMRRRGGIS